MISDCNLPLLHRLEQRALNLRRGAVDLIRKDEICKDRTLAHHELLLLLTVDHRSDKVCREQIRSELYPAELSVNDRGQGLDCKRLCQPRHPFQQNVAV